MYKNKDKLLVTKKRISNAAFVRPFSVNIYDFSLISAPITSSSFPLMGFVLPFLRPPHSMITRIHAKANKSGPDLKWNAIMSTISQAPTLGEPNALPVTCCVIMTVPVTLQCYFLKHARKHRYKEMFKPCADKQHCCWEKGFIIFFYPRIH